MHVTIFACSLSPSSRSFLLAEAAADNLRRRGVAVHVVDLRQLDLPLCDASSAYGHADAVKVAAEVQAASAILLAVPIYNYDVNAAAKNLVELTGKLWRDKVVGFLCAAGGKGSYMSITGLANSLMLDFHSLIVPRHVYAVKSDFDDGAITSEAIIERIDDLCERTLRLASVMNDD